MSDASKADTEPSSDESAARTHSNLQNLWRVVKRAMRPAPRSFRRAGGISRQVVFSPMPGRCCTYVGDLDRSRLADKSRAGGMAPRASFEFICRIDDLQFRTLII